MKEDRGTLCRSIESGDLAVEFFNLGDRMGHRFVQRDVLRKSDPRTLWLESIEGAAHDHWPPSPALQEVHIETRPDGRRVAMLVGQTGSNHYSASFEPGQRPGSICVDVACRMKSGAGPLASSYRMADGNSFDPRAIAVVAGRGQRCHIQAQSPVEQLCSVTESEGLLAIGPEGQTDLIPLAERPSTERPSTRRPSTRRPSTERPSTERPSTERPSTERPSTERPSTRRPSTRRWRYLIWVD